MVDTVDPYQTPESVQKNTGGQSDKMDGIRRLCRIFNLICVAGMMLFLLFITSLEPQVYKWGILSLLVSLCVSTATAKTIDIFRKR